MSNERFGDTDLGFVTLDAGICNKCAHVRDDGLHCDAFEDGIPEEVLRGIHDHHRPFPGDNGIQFEDR